MQLACTHRTMYFWTLLHIIVSCAIAKQKSQLRYPTKWRKEIKTTHARMIDISVFTMMVSCASFFPHLTYTYTNAVRLESALFSDIISFENDENNCLLVYFTVYLFDLLNQQNFISLCVSFLLLLPLVRKTAVFFRCR